MMETFLALCAFLGWIFAPRATIVIYVIAKLIQKKAF